MVLVFSRQAKNGDNCNVSLIPFKRAFVTKLVVSNFSVPNQMFDNKPNV